MRSRIWHTAALLVAILVSSALGAGDAHAATYDVLACAAGSGNGTSHWVPFAYGGAPIEGQGCWPGRGIPDDYNGGSQPNSGTGESLTAPAGDSITALSFNAGGAWTTGSQWDVRVDSGTGTPALWDYYQGNAWNWWDFWGSQGASLTGSWSQLRLLVDCEAGWSYCSGYSQNAWSGVVATIADSGDPALTIAGGGLSGGGWISGTQQLIYNASDSSGIRRTLFSVDGVGQSSDQRGCDYSYPVPCQNVTGATYSLDTTKLADGPHVASVGARDATDVNQTTVTAAAFNVSNTPPAAPALSVDGGGAWQSTNDWTLRFTNPDGPDPAPIVGVLYRVCHLDGTACVSTPVASGVQNQGPGQPNTLTGSLGITTPGGYKVSVWLEDAAGNATQANSSNPVTVNWDPATPGPAQISAPATTNGWVNGAQATAYSPQVTMAENATVPPSGIAGYAVTTDGSTPGSAVTDPVGQDSGQTITVSAPPDGWGEGGHTIEARAISAAGVPSSDVATVSFDVDRTAPAANAEGYGNPAPAWQPAPINVRLVATDALSGMGASDDGDPAHGGYIAYSVDAGPRQAAGGGLTTVTIGAQGQHSITYEAYDVAGNVSASKTVYVNVGTPGAPASFERGFSAHSGATATFTAARGFGTNCPAQVTLTPSSDTYVDQSAPQQTHGAASTLLVRSGVRANARALLDFGLPSANGCAVSSAQLRLYSSGGTSGRTLEAFRAGSPWTEASVSWNTRPGPTGPAATTTTTASGWQTFDVTELVQDIYSYGDSGLIVRDRDEDGDPSAGQSFDSTEAGVATRPQLTLSFK